MIYDKLIKIMIDISNLVKVIIIVVIYYYRVLELINID